MYFDYTYLIFILPCMLFAMWASSKVNSTYRRYAQVYSRKGITAEKACRDVLDANGLYDISIGRIKGNLTDHFDPTNNIIRLSDSVYGSSSVAAIGVACHEAGHAIQRAKGYAPYKIRRAIIPLTNIGSNMAMPLILIGFLFPMNGVPWLSYIGLFGFFFAVLFQLVTLPTEFDASKRALLAIESYGYLDNEELQGSRKVLQAAAMTYVAALATALGQFLRLFLIVASRNERDN